LTFTDDKTERIITVFSKVLTDAVVTFIRSIAHQHTENCIKSQAWLKCTLEK